jgi:integrase
MAYVREYQLKKGARRFTARYLGPDGKYHEERGFGSRRKAEKIAAEREVNSTRGEWASPVTAKLTFADYVETYYWPTTAHLEVSTRAAYRYNLDRHFVPRWGHLPMRRIVPSMIQEYVNEASGRLSARTVVKHHALLHRIFRRAANDRAVASNPCSHTELPKVIRKPKQIITVTQFNAILDNIDERHELMLLLAIETGLRWGELVALRPVDIDLVNHLVHVRRTLVEVSIKKSPTGQRITVKDYPKDDEQRDVQIEQATCRLIRQHMLKYAVREEDLLFTSSAGTPISRNNFRTKSWLPALEAAKLGRTVTFHGLRAAHASWLLAGGADLAVVQERLGHRQITTTQQYLGTLPDSGQRALAALRKIREAPQA